MYKLSKNVENRKIGNRNTRQNNKYVFKIDTKIGTKYAMSPFYKGTKLWDTLNQEIQFSDNIFNFKTHINNMYKVFDRNVLA